MRVALINNMNNNFFSLARYLRDRGIDAHVFQFDSIYNGFLPEADTFEDVQEIDYIHLISQITFRDFFNPFSRKVKRAIKKLKQELVGFDVVIGCGVLAFFERAGMQPLDVLIPYGGDVYQLTDLFNYSRKKYFPYSMLMRYIMKYQRAAIQKVRCTVSFASNDLHIADALANMGKPWIDWNIPMIYPIACPSTETRWDFLKNHDFVLFSQIRQTWKTGTDYNGNDRAIEGYAKFIKEHNRFKNPVFVLFEYGCDVSASKELIATLGIESYIKWVPSMNRKYIYSGLDHADLVTGIFNPEVISCGGVTYEAFSRSVPVIGCAKIERGGRHDLPLLHAMEPEEICAILTDFQENPLKYQKIGKKSKAWFDKEVGEGLIDRYVKLFRILSEDKMVTLDDPNGPLAHLSYQNYVKKHL